MLSLNRNIQATNNYLERPNEELTTYYATTKNYVVASSSMQGWRVTMEDTHSIIINGEPLARVKAYLGVFDGHGGRNVSAYLCNRLHVEVFREIANMPHSPRTALERAFLRTDRRMHGKANIRNEGSGSTAVLVLISNKTLYCVNLGDSRAVAYKGNAVVAMSEDHKPSLASEALRVRRSGGFIRNGRINGDLALSRAFGDFAYKTDPYRTQREQILSCCPDIFEAALDPSWEFVLLASDGVWDVMSNEVACEFVKRRLDRKMKLSTIAEELLMECMCRGDCDPNLAGMDNMTAIILVFKNQRAEPGNEHSFQNVNYFSTSEQVPSHSDILE